MVAFARRCFCKARENGNSVLGIRQDALQHGALNAHMEDSGSWHVSHCKPPTKKRKVRVKPKTAEWLTHEDVRIRQAEIEEDRRRKAAAIQQRKASRIAEKRRKQAEATQRAEQAATKK
eukprot:jgi/Chlat1/6668/Chrsp49S06130